MDVPHCHPIVFIWFFSLIEWINITYFLQLFDLHITYLYSHHVETLKIFIGRLAIEQIQHTFNRGIVRLGKSLSLIQCRSFFLSIWSINKFLITHTAYLFSRRTASWKPMIQLHDVQLRYILCRFIQINSNTSDRYVFYNCNALHIIRWGTEHWRFGFSNGEGNVFLILEADMTDDLFRNGFNLEPNY